MGGVAINKELKSLKYIFRVAVLYLYMFWEDFATMLLLYILFISLAIIMSGSSSVGPDSESLLTCCSKFHFEERV